MVNEMAHIAKNWATPPLGYLMIIIMRGMGVLMWIIRGRVVNLKIISAEGGVMLSLCQLGKVIRDKSVICI